MATRELVLELSTERLEFERGATEGQPGPISAFQALGQFG
jgi:hypothetical protein